MNMTKWWWKFIPRARTADRRNVTCCKSIARFLPRDATQSAALL